MAISPKEITRETYQATAHAFACNVADLAPTASIEKYIAFLPPQAKIIDMGCGSGRDASLFTERGYDVLGIDFSSHLLDIAKDHAPLAQFQCMDMEKIHFPAASFDGVWAACSLSHIQKIELPHLLQQIRFLLKEEGCFYLTVKKGVGEGLEIDTRYEGSYQKFWSFFEADELRDFLEAAGFEIMELAIVEKEYPYQTGDALRVFCR